MIGDSYTLDYAVGADFNTIADLTINNLTVRAYRHLVTEGLRLQ